jgi:lipoate---protein ligase
MAWQHIDYKVPGGKLLRIDADIKGGKEGDIIQSIRITGDFFMHPEDALERIEKALSRVPIDQRIPERLNECTRDVRMVGISVNDFLLALDRFKTNKATPMLK